MQRDYRVALIGYGVGGAVFHAPFLSTTPGLALSVIVTRDLDRQAQARRDHPRARIVATTDALWQDARDLDLVVISTPNRTHAPLATQALTHGLHAVVDKPLAISAPEARTLAAAAAAAGRLVIPFQNRRWDGDFLTLRALLDDGALGTVFRFESRFERWRPEPKGGWRESSGSDDGGGLLFDIGSHLIDQALQLFGPATHVYAELDRRRAGVESDDDAYVAVTHESGVRSHLYATVLAAQQADRFRVLGSRAAYTKRGLDVQEAALRAGQAPGGPLWGEEPSAAWGLLGRDGSTQPVPTTRGDYPAFYRGVAAALRGEAPPPVSVDDAIAMLDIVDAARRSATERAVVAVGNGARV